MRRIPVILWGVCLWLLCVCGAANAQSFRFDVRAEPEIIPANGVSTSSILVQVQNTGRASISATPVVRFVTSRGTIEGQATLVNGIARVLLRSAASPGTAIVTAIIGNSREECAVEFSNNAIGGPRYLEVKGAVAYGTEEGILTGSGPCVLEWGALHIESGTRLDVNLRTESLWAQGSSGQVVIRYGRGKEAKELRGDRLYLQLGRRRGVMRRSDTKFGPQRQEFEGTDFHVPEGDPLPAMAVAPLPTEAQADLTRPAVPASDPTTISSGADPIRKGPDIPLPSNVTPSAPGDKAPDTTPNGVAPIVPNPPLEEPAQTTPEKAEVGKAEPPIKADSAKGAPVTPAIQPVSIRLDNPNGQGSATPAAKPGVGGVSLLGSSNVQIIPVPSALFNGSGDSGTSRLRLVPESSATSTSAGRYGLGARDASESEEPRLALLEPRTPAGSDPTIPGAPNNEGVEGPNKNEAPPAVAPHDDAAVAPVVPDVMRIMEPAPPEVDPQSHYWITGKVVRVFPRDQMQFETAKVFYNGGKVFGLKLYVLPLDGSVSPANPLASSFSLNSSAGLTLNVPFYYMASGRGTGAVYLQHAPGGGFSSEQQGFQLAVEQNYYMSPRSQGRLSLGQIGKAWNLAWSHRLQLSSTSTANFYLDMPRHTSPYFRTSIAKDLPSLQLGFEGVYSRPGGNLPTDMLGQFFARTRPKQLGRSGWSYNLAANFSGQRRFLQKVANEDAGGIDDGLPNHGAGVSKTRYEYRPRLAQTLNLSMQSPGYTPWKGASFSATVLGIAYNSSVGTRGLAPGALLSFGQNFGRRGSIQLNYTYDRSQLSLYGTSFTHFVSGTAVFNPFNRVSLDGYVSKSLVDNSMYATSSLEFQVAPKWRLGAFTDYASFASVGTSTYGLSVARMIGNRELSLNWDSGRGRFYFEFGGFRY